MSEPEVGVTSEAGQDIKLESERADKDETKRDEDSSTASVCSTNPNPRDDDLLPAKVLFKRMADLDCQQNRRLSASVNGLKTASQADLINGGRHKNKSTKMRFLVCTLGLLSLATSQMARMILNFSITQMVDKRMLTGRGSRQAQTDDGSCPWPTTNDDAIVDSTPEPDFTTLMTTLESVDELKSTSGSLTEDILTPSEVSSEATPTNTEANASDHRPRTTDQFPHYDQFEWSMKKQQVLLGGFYYSYFVFMVLGGRVAEMYGAKYVLLLSVAGSAIISLTTPWMARNSFALLVLSRVVMGAIQSGVFPGMYALINKWLTMNEASIYAPLIKMNLRLGSVLASSLAGMVEGWPNVFYWTGGLCAVWSLLWCLIASSDPADNKWVSPDELMHINRKKPQSKKAVDADLERNKAIELASSEGQIELNESEQKVSKAAPSQLQQDKTPWIRILTSPSVIGLVLVKLTFNYALDFLSILLPSYLDYVHHLTKEQRSGITTPMFAIQVGLIVLVGWLAKVVVQKRPYKMSKTVIRKLFQGIASFGLAASLLLFTLNDCNILAAAVILQVASFLSMFTAGGETMLPYDLSSKYPATIMAIANSVANISAVTTTTLAGFILGDKGGSYERWNVLIYLIAGANIVGGLAFTLLVSAEPIDF